MDEKTRAGMCLELQRGHASWPALAACAVVLASIMVADRALAFTARELPSVSAIRPAQATDGAGGAGELTQAPVSAQDLKAAIEAIKQRLAEQQESRKAAGTDGLAGELEDARRSIDELTQSMARLRAERDELLAKLKAGNGQIDAKSAELEALRGEVSQAASRTAGEMAALQKSLDDTDAARQALQAAKAEVDHRLESALAEISDLTQTVKQAWSERDIAERALTEQRTQAASELESRDAALAEAQQKADGLASQLAAASETTTQETETLRSRLAEAQSAAQARDAALAEASGQLDDLRDVATSSVGEVEALGGQLLQAMAQNEELVRALAELRASRAILDGELTAARRDIALYAGQASSMRDELDRARAGGELPAGPAVSDAKAAELSKALEAARAEIDSLSRELILRDRTLARGAAESPAESPVESDADTLKSRLAALEQRLGASEGARSALEAELASLKADAPASGPAAAGPQVVVASLNDAASIDAALAELHAVDMGDGWLMTVPDDIAFAIGSDELAPEAAPTLEKVATLARSIGATELRIVGHTDSFGDASVNRNLSLRRARSVRDFLRQASVPEGVAIDTEGMGEGAPIASNDTSEGRRANRRVEIYIRHNALTNG